MGLTKQQTKLLDRVKSDGALMRGLDGFSFVSGETAHACVVKNLMAKGALVDNEDSLFPGYAGQTLRAL